MSELTDKEKQIVFAMVAAVNCEQGIITEREGKVACLLFRHWLEKIQEPDAVNIARMIYENNPKGEYFC